jgi:hypothetical protein
MEADAEPAVARAKLRAAIVDAQWCPEVEADRKSGWQYTGAVMRAVEAAIKGTADPALSQQAGGRWGAPSCRGAPSTSRLVLPGDGDPGTLGIWWSDFEAARQTEQLRANGITHRLNVAAEAVDHFEDDGIQTFHVPIEHIFAQDVAADLLDHWCEQFEQVLNILRSLCHLGSIVNVSCQMGKNRSGCCCLAWLCAERGWSLDEGVEELRSITALACGNPHLVTAVANLVGAYDVDVPLNPADDGCVWICISPPTSPRDGGTATFEDVACNTIRKLRQDPPKAASAVLVDTEDEEEELAEACALMRLFDTFSEEEYIV